MELSTTHALNLKKLLYCLLAIAGSIAPWYWLIQDPAALLSLPLFFQRAFANQIATAVATDLVISASVFFCFVWIELKRWQVSRFWILLYVGLTFGVGLSCSLPLFLYHREQMVERQTLR